MSKHSHHPAAKHAKSEAYRVTSLEHLEPLNRCHAEGADPAMTIYLAGLCVECMLRAYRMRIDPEFDAKHDLAKLASQAQFAANVPQGEATLLYSERLGRLATAWSSNDRFATAAVLTKRLRDLKYRPKSETLAYAAGILYEDAQWLVALGRERWS